MAYTPTLEDFDEPIKKTGGYTPTLEDFEGRPESLGDKLKKEFPSKSSQDVLNEQLGGASNIGKVAGNIVGSLAQHGLNLAEGTANIPNLLSLGYIPKFAAHQQIPLYNPEAPESQLTENLLTGGELGLGAAGLAKAGLAGLGAASKIPAVSRLLEKVGSSSGEEATNLVNRLLNGNKVSEAHKPIIDEIRTNYNTNLENSNKNYDLIEKLAKNKGYTGEGKLSRALTGGKSKSINAQSTLDDIKNLEVNDNTLKELINGFDENNSYELAHKLQSRLGSEGYNLLGSADKVKRSLGYDYLKLRRDLVGDINKSFKENKDTDLAEYYKRATANHKETVVPYQKNSTINKLVTKRDLDEVNPENIHNTLSKDATSVRKVVNELSPESKDLILAKKLTPAIEQTERQGMQVNPKELLKQISDVKNGKFNKFLTPEHREMIRNLEDQLEFERKYINPTKTGLKWGTGIGASALGLGALKKGYNEIFG